MTRFKHLTMLIVKVVMLVLVFALTSVLTSLQDFVTDGINFADSEEGASVEIVTGNGATATYEKANGRLVFDITQSGTQYNDITVRLGFENITYSSNFIHDVMGEHLDERHDEFLAEMENGPWLGTVTFLLMSEQEVGSFQDQQYTFIDSTSKVHVDSLSVAAANKRNSSEAFDVTKGSATTVTLVFGSEEAGALPSGRYFLALDLKLKHPEGKILNLEPLEVVGAVGKVCLQAVKEKGTGIFNVYNWLTFYAMLMILGWFVYLWRDGRVVVRVFLAAKISCASSVIVTVLRNGTVVNEYEESDSGIAQAIIAAGLVWVFLTLIIPIRIVWYLLRDIIYLFRHDEALEEFFYIGNIMGSVGIFVCLFGIAGLFGAGKTVGIIALVVGLLLCFIASKICKAVED